MAGRHAKKHAHGVYMANRTQNCEEAPKQYADHCADEGSAEAGTYKGKHDRQHWHPWQKDDYESINMTCNDDCAQGRNCDCDDKHITSLFDASIFMVVVALCILWFVLAVIGMASVVRWLV